MANQIELITKYSPQAWDTVYKQESVSSLLDVADSAFLKFEGTKTVKIAKFQNGGLHDYYRNNTGDDRVPAVPGSGTNFVNSAGFGYQKSNTRLVWEEFTMACDRAAAFQIEEFDNEESGGKLIGLGVTEISRTTIIPEVDAYCFAKIASYTSAALGNRVPAHKTGGALDTPYADLNKAFVYFDNHEVLEEDQLCFASPNFINALRQSTEFSVVKPLLQSDLGDNKNVKFEVTEYSGRKIIKVVPSRFRTNINIFGREGYGWKAGSQAIAFMLVSKSAIIHVTKYEKVKVIGGEMNLAGAGFDGYTVYARIYHDVFVPDNKRYGIYVATDGDALTDNGENTFELNVEIDDTSKKITKITAFPGNQIFDLYTSTATETVGNAATGTLTKKKVGDVMTISDATVSPAVVGTKVYAVNEAGIVLAEKQF